MPSPESLVLRPDAERTRVGTALPLIDGPAYVTGKAVFGADVRLPGMLTAVIARPPVVGGTRRAARRRRGAEGARACGASSACRP